MTKGKYFKKIPEINFCIICRKFYKNSCCCTQIWRNQEISLPYLIRYLECNGYGIINNFLCLVLIVYNYTRILFKSQNECDELTNLKKITLKGFRDITTKQNLFSKYIYLCNGNGSNIDPKRGFYVYMMSVHLEGDNKDSSLPKASRSSSPSIDESTETTPRREIFPITSTSNSSLGSKRSGTSSMLSRISKTLKRRHHEKKLSDISNSDFSSTSKETAIQRQTKSKIPIAKSRMKVSTSRKSVLSMSPNASHKSQSFFRKLILKSPNTKFLAESKPMKANSGIQVVEKRCHSYTTIGTEKDLSDMKISPTASEYHIRTTSSRGFSACGSPILDYRNLSLNLNTIEGLREAIELTQRLQDDQTHLTHMISKYIHDHSFEKELLNALTNHAKLHMDAERRAQNLTHEMWLQQSEVMKAHETTLKENLNAVIKQNRQLQEEMETLVKKNEQIWSIKLRQFPEFMRQPDCDSRSMLIENLSKNNNKLRERQTGMTSQIEEQNRELEIIQRKSQLLEQQLRNSNSQVHTLKAMLQRIQTENELEHANLSHQLQTSQLTIKESAEAGDVLLEDLDALKRQAQTKFCAINWTKFKSRGNNIPDLIYMCRSCINELAKELSNKHTELILKEKDNNILSEEIKRLEENIEKYKTEQERLLNQLKSCDNHDAELTKHMTKCNALEHELGEYKKDIERVVGEFEKEKVTLIASVEEMDKLNKKVIEKDEELILSKEKMTEYKSENDALRMQVHGLKQVLAASGMGEVARELAETQEKMTFFQSQYYQLLSEKNYLIEQLQSANVERGTLNHYQDIHQRYILDQRENLETLTKDNLILRQQLEMERNQVSALKMERSKLKEEKNVMREIYHQLKNEINKVQKLQGEVTGMNIEANRLAIIAEFNKQLGEKLQCEVAEKDVKITELQGNVEKLNHAQLENSQDKVALCVELTEICTLNDRLNNTLVAEHQKTVHLAESKHRLESSASMQLKAIEEMQRVERAALKELLSDYKTVVTQRNNLMTAQNEYLQQISDLRSNAVIQARHIEGMNERYINAVQEIENLESKLKEADNEIGKLNGAVRENKYAVKLLEEEKNELQTQKEELESTKAYLQKTTQKLYSDLDESRKADTESSSQLKKEIKKLEELQSNLDQTTALMARTSSENQTLIQDIAQLSGEYERLYANYETSFTSEQILKRELEKAQASIEDGDKEMERLKKEIDEKDSEITCLQEYSSDFKKQIKELESSVEGMEVQSKLLTETSSTLNNLQSVLNELQTEHKDCDVTISALRNENRRLQEGLKTQLDQMESSCSYQKDFIEELAKEYHNQKEVRENDMCTLTERLRQIKDEYESKRNDHDNLLKSHKDLAYKLLKSVRLLVDEKLGREKAESGMAKLSENIAKITAEKAVVENDLKKVSKELAELKGRIGDLTADKKSLQVVLSDLQELYKKSLLKCHDTEHQLGINQKKTKATLTAVKSTKMIALKETKSKLQYSEERIRKLKEELDKCHILIMELKNKISNLKQQLTVTEFQKCELSLRLHETEAKFKTEHSMNKQLNDINQLIVAEILEMERHGTITHHVSETLLGLIQGEQWSFTEPSNNDKDAIKN